MAKRKKSIYDLAAQYYRIAKLAGEIGTRDGQNAAHGIQDVNEYVRAYRAGAERSENRENKAFETVARYMNNIRQSKSYQNARNKASRMRDDDRARLRYQVRSRQYSANTYMGMSKG